MSVSAVWYLAWVDDDAVAFDPAVHNVQDTELLGFTFSQREGEFATLRLLTRNPISGLSNWALGLLGPGRKRWAWFSWGLNGAAPSPLALLRLVGVPTDVFLATVTLDFSARPSDFNEQKAALNDALRVLPYWDPVFIDEQKRENMDIILDTYAGVWYVDPVTHEISLSDLLLGEDGAQVFQINEHAADGLQLTIGDPPLSSVTVDAEIAWTQRAVGSISMGFTSSSYTLKADAFPKVGASMGDGWKILGAAVSADQAFETKTVQTDYTLNIDWWDGQKTTSNIKKSHDSVVGPGLPLPPIITDSQQDATYSKPDSSGHIELTSWSQSQTWSTGLIPRYVVSAGYTVGYDAKRPFTEHVTFVLTADVQPLATLPGDDETMRIDGLNTADLSEPIDGVPPIGDPRRRSYMTQARGEDSLQYLILLARAQLRKRARAVEISFAPFLTRLEDLKLNRSAQVFDWRIPGGNAIGKIISFSLTLTPPTDDDAVNVGLECTIGCTIGNGGTVSAVGGEEEYVDDEYIDADQDYQQYDGAVLTFDDEVGFTPPLFAPNDDGMDFITPFGLNDASVFEVPISIHSVANDQIEHLEPSAGTWAAPGLPIGPPPGGFNTWQEARQAMVQDRNNMMKALLSNLETEISFKLKSMSADFSTEVPITVTQLKIPQMINLAAT